MDMVVAVQVCGKYSAGFQLGGEQLAIGWVNVVDMCKQE